ncbi:MAG: chemotaxis protein CheX [Thiotrichaceae bacterium]|nr:chemotaxis protein CheX [Thiotrichaceae bacterium]PCI12774.1 MAG: chemotaxis protein CheC [Thiotrichales bacterium]
MLEISELQRDYITEILNISMGSAASVLSEMVSEEVALSVPEVDFLPRSIAAGKFDQSNVSKMSGVTQSISGAVYGDALLMFPEEKTLSIVRILLGETVPVESLTEMEQEAMCEIGNIILNAVVSSIADILKKEIMSSLPRFIHGTGNEVFSVESGNNDDLVMFLKVDFGLESQSINGYVTLILNVDSLQGFIAQLDEQINAI